MKKYLSLKYLTSVCFLAFIGFMLVYNARPAFYVAYHQLENIRSGSGFSKAQAEYEYNDSLPGKSFYVSFNGGFQRLMGIRSVNERYKLDNGHLTYVVPQMDTTAMAENTVAFRDALAELDIPFGYISTPFKIDPQDKQLPPSIEDYANENADQFLSVLEENDVPTLDLRKLEKEQSLDHYSLYFITDHHWKPETGFWAYTQIVSWLESLDADFAVDPALTDAQNYTFTVYEDVFFGSNGWRVGALYSEMDDFTVITPNFETSLHFQVPSAGINRQGTYEETLLFLDILNQNMGRTQENRMYGTYLYQDEAQEFIYNHSQQQALQVQSKPKKLVILKDSNGLVVVPYLGLSYDEVCFMDLRLFNGDFLAFLQEYQPDMVLAMYNPGAFEEHNANMFQFIR